MKKAALSGGFIFACEEGIFASKTSGVWPCMAHHFPIGRRFRYRTEL